MWFAGLQRISWILSLADLQTNGSGVSEAVDRPHQNSRVDIGGLATPDKLSLPG